MIWKREPAVIVGIVQAIIALAVAFGFNLKPEQIGSILAVTAAVLALVTRSQVTPTARPANAPSEPDDPVA